MNTIQEKQTYTPSLTSYFQRAPTTRKDHNNPMASEGKERVVEPSTPDSTSHVDTMITELQSFGFSVLACQRALLQTHFDDTDALFLLIHRKSSREPLTPEETVEFERGRYTNRTKEWIKMDSRTPRSYRPTSDDIELQRLILASSQSE